MGLGSTLRNALDPRVHTRAILDSFENAFSSLYQVIKTLDDTGNLAFDMGASHLENLFEGDIDGLFSDSWDIFLEQVETSAIRGEYTTYGFMDVVDPLAPLDTFTGAEGFGTKTYIRTAGSGLTLLTQRALAGDTDAMKSVIAVIIGVVISVFSFGSTSGTVSSALSEYVSQSMATWLGNVVANAEFISSIYTLTSSLYYIGAINNSQFMDLMKTLNELENAVRSEYAMDYIMGNMDAWLPGGILYNQIYSGGDLFNVTGSRNQVRFIGLRDMNANMQLKQELGFNHDFYKMLNTDNIGTDHFDATIFNKM